jgi:hypothetical protein
MLAVLMAITSRITATNSNNSPGLALTPDDYPDEPRIETHSSAAVGVGPGRPPVLASISR